MKRFTKVSWLVMTFMLLALAACGGGAAPVAAPAVDTGPLFTQVALTAVALQTQVAQPVPLPTGDSQASPTPPPTPTPVATNTPVPTDTPLPTSTPVGVKAVAYPTASTPAGPFPSMSVTLIANNKYTYGETVSTGQILIFRAEVENVGQVPLQVVANLSVPDGWGVSEDQYSDCPTTQDLTHKSSCTITWKFNPQVTGQVILRVYVRGIYTDAYGNTQRITESPSFVLNVVAP